MCGSCLNPLMLNAKMLNPLLLPVLRAVFPISGYGFSCKTVRINYDVWPKKAGNLLHLRSLNQLYWKKSIPKVTVAQLYLVSVVVFNHSFLRTVRLQLVVLWGIKRRGRRSNTAQLFRCRGCLKCARCVFVTVWRLMFVIWLGCLWTFLRGDSSLEVLHWSPVVAQPCIAGHVLPL